MNVILKEDNEKISSENLLYVILMIIGGIGFSLKYAVQIMDFFVWLIMTNIVLYVMIVIGLFGLAMFIIRNSKKKQKC